MLISVSFPLPAYESIRRSLVVRGHAAGQHSELQRVHIIQLLMDSYRSNSAADFVPARKPRAAATGKVSLIIVVVED